jgi:hypothetical protein
MMWKIHEKISPHHYKLRQQKEVASGFHDPETMEELCCVFSNKQYTTTRSSSNLKKVSYFLDECSVCEYTKQNIRSVLPLLLKMLGIFNL